MSSRTQFRIDTSPGKDQDMINNLGPLFDLLKGAQNVLFKNADDKFDPSVLDHIALWQEPAHTDLVILKKYVEGLENAADHQIEAQFKNFVDNHNNVLFNVILPRIELLNELYKYINIADRKLGEAEHVKVVGRINNIIQKTKPVLANWLSVQKDLESRLNYEKGLSGRGLKKGGGKKKRSVGGSK